MTVLILSLPGRPRRLKSQSVTGKFAPGMKLDMRSGWASGLRRTLPRKASCYKACWLMGNWSTRSIPHKVKPFGSLREKKKGTD